MTFCDLTIYNDNPLLIRLCTELDILQNFEWFPWNICDGCGMPTGDAYSSGHLVLSLQGLAFVLLVETSDNLYQFVKLLPDLTFLLNLTFHQILVSIEHLQRVWHAYRGRLLLRTPGPVPLGLAYVLPPWGPGGLSRECVLRIPM